MDINLPMIDLNLSQERIVAEIRKSLETIGFFYIKNYQIDERLILNVEDIAKNFFEQSLEEKNKFHMSLAGKRWRGYFAVGEELTMGKPDIKEGYYFGREEAPCDLVLHGPNLWSSNEAKEAILVYMEQMEKLAQKLMGLISLSLNLPVNYFEKTLSPLPTTLFRLFYYPANKQIQGQHLGVQEHTDMGFLTILKQDQHEGLEVKDLNNKWLAAPPIAKTLNINIGDMLEVWTRGFYRATPHRVRAIVHENRLSMPYFFDPAWNCILSPMDSKLLPNVVSRNKSRWDDIRLEDYYNQLTYGEFVWGKVSKVFPWLAS